MAPDERVAFPGPPAGVVSWVFGSDSKEQPWSFSRLWHQGGNTTRKNEVLELCAAYWPNLGPDNLIPKNFLGLTQPEESKQTNK